jgi:prophage tail gpP-like protein
VARLARGTNVLEASADRDDTQRFSTTTVKVQREGAEGRSAADNAHVEAAVTDGGVTRYRPKVIVAETQGGTASVRERAEWEQRRAVAKSRKCTVKVVGWRHAGGLWRPGQTVRFDDDWLGVSGTWLVGQAKLSLGSGGTVTTLELAPPGAFEKAAGEEDE